MFINLKHVFVKSEKYALWLLVGILLWGSNISYAQIGISTPTVSSGELIRASDWNKVKLDLETLAAAVGILQNQTWESSGSNTYYDSGNVGIGINNPTGTLHIFADNPAPNAVLLQLGTTDDPDRVQIDEDGDVTIDGKLVVRDSDIYDTVGDLELSGEDNLYLSVDWNNNDADTNAIYFGKNSDGAGPNFVELMRLTETGRLGVGVSNPVSTFQVAGAIQIAGDAGACIATKAGALRYDGGAVERCNGSNWDALATTNVSDNLGNHVAEQNIDLDAFRLVGEGGSSGIAIDSNGEVGIGTDNPISLLDIVSDTTPNLIVRTTAVTGQDAALTITGAQTTSVSADIASIRLTNKDSTPFEGARIALRNGDGADSTSEGDLVFFTNTGTANNLTEKMRILDDGKVGIGISEPVAQFQVFKNTPAPNEIIIQIGTNADTNRFSVDEDGDVFNDGNYYVGGGNVLSNSGSVTVGGEDNLYLVADWNNNDTDNRAIIFGKNGVGGGGGFAELGRINENGRFGLNENNPANLIHAGISEPSDRVAVIENLATTGSPEGLLVLTGQGTGPGANFAVGTGTEASHTKKFVVTNEGRVGIGTQSPSAELDVRGNILAYNSYPTIYVNHSGTTLGGIRADATTKLEFKTLTTAPLSFQVNSDQKMIILDNGNVGIGTPNPSEKLEVSGNAISSGVAINVINSASIASFAKLNLTANSKTASIFEDGSGGYISGGGLIINDPSNIHLQTNGTSQLSIKSGNVGIGTTTPAAKLEVNGETRLTGVSSDGTGKVVCVKNDGNLGTCTNAPNASGVCSCS